MVEVGESEYDPTIVQFGFSLLHAGGPPLRSMELRHRRARGEKLDGAVLESEQVVLSEIACFRQLSRSSLQG
jgi:ATP-dependent DNA ligase